MLHFYLWIVLFEGCNQARFCFFGNTVASASADDTIKIWSLDGSELASLVGHGDRVYDLSFSPDGKILVSGSWDFTALLWHLDLDF